MKTTSPTHEYRGYVYKSGKGGCRIGVALTNGGVYWFRDRGGKLKRWATELACKQYIDQLEDE